MVKVISDLETGSCSNSLKLPLKCEQNGQNLMDRINYGSVNFSEHLQLKTNW